MSDSEIITLPLVGELLTIDSEKSWFSFCTNNLRDLFPNFCTRTRFHKTRKSLYKVMDEFLNYKYEQYRSIDSMPIPVCKFGRAHFNRTFRHAVTYGKCTFKKETYFGFKLHALISFDSYLTDFTLTPANIDDRTAASNLFFNYYC